MLFEYTSPRRELTMLVVIDTDCIGIVNPAIIWSQPSSYHMITTTMAPQNYIYATAKE